MDFGLAGAGRRCGYSALLVLACAALSAAGQEQRIIRAAAYVDASGELRKDAVVRIEGGKIASVGDAATPADEVTVDEYEGAVLCPGLIDVNAALGAFGQLAERQSAIQSAAVALDTFDPYHRELRAALRAGVTCFALVPDDSNLAGGRIAVCKTAGADGRPYVLRDDGPMKLSLSPAVFERDREPTSRAGALGLLRSALDAAQKPDGPSPLSALVGGNVTAFAAAPRGADVLALLELAKTYKLKLVLLHQLDVRAIGAEIATAGAGVVVGPFDLSTPPRTATAAGILEKLGVTVAVAGGLPEASADSLRLGAAVAARNGMSLAAARRAVTITPAQMLGVAERVGSIEAGRDADLVVFSGDPLDLRSRVLAVYVDGRRVYAEQDAQQ